MTGSGRASGLRLAGAGVQFAATLIAALYLAQWLDRRFGTAPVFLYVGVGLGAVGGMTALYRQLLRLQRDVEEEEARRR